MLTAEPKAEAHLRARACVRREVALLELRSRALSSTRAPKWRLESSKASHPHQSADPGRLQPLTTGQCGTSAAPLHVVLFRSAVMCATFEGYC